MYVSTSLQQPPKRSRKQAKMTVVWSTAMPFHSGCKCDKLAVPILTFVQLAGAC